MRSIMKIKIILGVLVLFFVLLAAAVLIIGAHLGDLVKAGLQVAGPKVTQTSLTVEKVEVSLLGGSAGVNGLVLGNPEGYQAPQSISVSNASVSLVAGSVLSDKIVIRSVEGVLAVSVRNGKDRRCARCRVGLDAVGAVSRTKRSAALDSRDSSMAATGPDPSWRPPCF